MAKRPPSDKPSPQPDPRDDGMPRSEFFGETVPKPVKMFTTLGFQFTEEELRIMNEPDEET